MYSPHYIAVQSCIYNILGLMADGVTSAFFPFDSLDTIKNVWGHMIVSNKKLKETVNQPHH